MKAALLHLFLGPFPLHRDGVVRPVVRLSAEYTNTGLILLTEQLQESFVLWTHPVFHVSHWLYELVLGEPSSMGFQMLLTIGSQTHKAGFERFWPALPEANVTQDLLPGRRCE